MMTIPIVKTTKATFAALTFLVSINAFARAGGTIGNGGDAFSSHQETRLLDAMEFADEFLPSREVAYTQIISPRLSELEAKLPKTAAYLRTFFVRGTNPRWYFSQYTLKDAQTTGTTPILLTEYEHQQIGINTGSEIFIQKKFYTLLPSDEERAYLLTHEMLWNAVKTTNDGKMIRALVGRILSRFNYRIDTKDLGQEIKTIISDTSSPLFQIVNSDLATVPSASSDGDHGTAFLKMCNSSTSTTNKTLLSLVHIANYSEAIAPNQASCQKTYEYFIDRFKINLESRGLEDVAVLTYFPRIEQLNLINNEIKDFSALAQLPHLKSLDMRLNRLTDLPNLSSFKALRTINLAHNRVSNLAGMKSPVLEIVDLSYNRIFDGLELLGDLPHLFELDLSHNNLESLKGLNFSAIPNLKRLTARENRLVDLSTVITATSLVELDLSHNQLSTTAGLETIPDIESVNLESNNLHAVTVDELPRRIKALNLSDNAVERFYGDTTRQAGLKILGLKHSHIMSLKDLNVPFFAKIESLDLSDSALSSVAGVREFQALVQLNLLGSMPIYQSLPAGAAGQDEMGRRLFDVGYLFDLQKLTIPAISATANLEHCGTATEWGPVGPQVCPLKYLILPHKNSHQETIQLEISRVAGSF